MATKQKFLTDEQAIEMVNLAVQQIKETMAGLPLLGAYQLVRVNLNASLATLKGALGKLVEKI